VGETWSLPPEYVSVPIELVYGDLPRAIAITGMRIWGLGWRHHYRYSDPIPFEDLCRLCRLSRSRMYAHIDHLRDRGVLRYTDVGGDGKLTFYFEQTGAPATDSSPIFRTDADMSVVASVLPHGTEHSTTTKEGGVGGTNEPVLKIGLTERAWVLARMGVLEPTRSEIAGLAWATVEYLEAWEAWLDTQAGRVGIGLVIEQMRRGILAPCDHVIALLVRYGVDAEVARGLVEHGLTAAQIEKVWGNG